MNKKPIINYRIILKNGREISVRGRSMCRDFGIGCMEVYKDDNEEKVAARFEISEIAGVVFDTEEDQPC